MENECIRLYFLSFPSYCSENAEEEIQTEIDFANNIFHFKGTVVHISSNSPFKKKKTWHVRFPTVLLKVLPGKKE